MHFTLVTWNCCGGPPDAKLGALASFDADIAVLQEAPRTSPRRPDLLYWSGLKARKGVLVTARAPFTVTPLALHVPENPTPSAYACQVDGPVSFTLLAVWSRREPYPYYKGGVLQALNALKKLPPPYVVMGDFNGNVIWDRPNARHKHAAVVARLESEFGLASAYHHFFAEEQGRETRPTLYWMWQRHKAYHIDYCFLPTSWLHGVSLVRVASFEQLKGLSDHRPLIVRVRIG